MASERTREIREWLTFGLSLLTLIGIPCGMLVLRNNRLEIREEWRAQLQAQLQLYVTAESFKAENAKLAAENTNLRAEVIVINAKLDKIQIQLVRLTDAVKLRPDP